MLQLHRLNKYYIKIQILKEKMITKNFYICEVSFLLFNNLEITKGIINTYTFTHLVINDNIINNGIEKATY